MRNWKKLSARGKATGRDGLIACAVLLLVSCSRVLLSQGYSGTVVDGESKTHLSGVWVEIAVTRVSSYDGPSVFRTDFYLTNERGQFFVPQRKKIVQSVQERSEDMRYVEV